MIKVEAYIKETEGKAKVILKPMVLKDEKPTPLEVAAWEEMRGRIFAKVAESRRRRR